MVKNRLNAKIVSRNFGTLCKLQVVLRAVYWLRLVTQFQRVLACLSIQQESFYGQLDFTFMSIVLALSILKATFSQSAIETIVITLTNIRQIYFVGKVRGLDDLMVLTALP